jgi:hypothetical protein
VLSLFLYIEVAFLSQLGAIAPEVLIIIAIVEAAVVLGASYVLAHPVRFVIAETDIEVVATPRDWAFGGAAVAAIIAIIGFNVFLIATEGTAGEWLWLALAIACVAYMVYAGRNLGLLLAAIWNVLKGVALALVAALASALAAVFGICRALLLALNGVLAILSYPFQILMRLFRRPAPTAMAAAR